MKEFLNELLSEAEHKLNFVYCFIFFKYQGLFATLLCVCVKVLSLKFLTHTNHHSFGFIAEALPPK